MSKPMQDYSRQKGQHAIIDDPRGSGFIIVEVCERDGDTVLQHKPDVLSCHRDIDSAQRTLDSWEQTEDKRRIAVLWG